MIKSKVMLYPESRGYEVHSFETLAEAEAFCANNPDAEIVNDCPVCHGKGWYKEEAAPVTSACDCQDIIPNTENMVQEALKALWLLREYATGDIYLFQSDIVPKVFGAYDTIRAALTARQEPVLEQKLRDYSKEIDRLIAENDALKAENAVPRNGDSDYVSEIYRRFRR